LTSSTLTREQLYELVWSEPMLKVAARYNVSSIYMARVPDIGYCSNDLDLFDRVIPLNKWRIKDKMVAPEFTFLIFLEKYCPLTKDNVIFTWLNIQTT